MFVETISFSNLANNSYVIGSERSGQCAFIDPVRVVDHYTTVAANHDVLITYALETHLYNDFISGARELAAQIGCQVGASASGMQAAIAGSILRRDGRSNTQTQVVDESGTPAWINKGYPVSTGEE